MLPAFNVSVNQILTFFRFRMGLTISSLFSRLFGKRQMRILMGNFIFIFINYVGVCWWRHESKWRHINLFLTSKFLFWKSLLRPEVPKFSLLMHSPTAALFMLTLWTLRLFKVPVTREYTECFLTLLFMYSLKHYFQCLCHHPANSIIPVLYQTFNPPRSLTSLNNLRDLSVTSIHSLQCSHCLLQ